MSQPLTRCAGCQRSIDPAYDAPIVDEHGRHWHPTCRASRVGPQDRHDGGVGPLVAWVLVTVLFPLVGLVVGIVYLFRNRIGPGLGLILTALVMMGLYFVLLASG